MENFTKERLEESNRLKEKACEDCMRELEIGRASCRERV